MTRTRCAALLVTAVVLAATAAAAESITLARHPDYHAGTIAFSYLGDIWVAKEDGTNVRRLTDHPARDTFPRFSPDGRWIAFSSSRYGNNDVFVMPAAGGAPRRLTFHTGSDDVIGWSRDSQRVLFRATRGDGVFPTVAVLYEIAATGGQEKPLPLDWGYWGSYSPDGKSLVFNRHPSSWSRKHYRGSYAADLWIADLSGPTFTKLLPDERYNRYWPMWGADDAIYFVGDPLPEERSVKPGTPEVRRSVNNIYRVPARGGGQAVQVTKHSSGNLYWPSMSSDGKVIVYEENFGLWKLDVASGRTAEITIDVVSDEKENEIEYEALTNEVGAFDLSPSGRRAVISARGQLLTIATDRGDITRLAADRMASRNEQPKWSPDGKYIAFVSDRSGRDEVWISDPEGRAPKKITDLDNEKGSLVWTPDSKALLYTATDRKLYSYGVADGKTAVVASSDVWRILSVDVSPDSKWVMYSKADRTQRTHVYIAPLAGGEERHISDDSVLYSENNAVWTADGRYVVFTSTESTPTGIASQGGFTTTTTLWSVALRDRERDPADRDIDNEAEGLVAEAAARQSGRGGGAGGGAAQPVEVRIDWGGIARRARQINLPGTPIGALAAAAEGHIVAVNVGTGPIGGGRGAPPPLGTTTAGIYVVNAETGQSARVPPPPSAGDSPGGGGGGRGGLGFFAGRDMAFARDGRTLYFRFGNGLYAAPVNLQALAPGAPAAGSGGRGGRGGGAQPAGESGSGGAQTARQVTYTANIEIDRKALRRQVFNEGWRIMKNRFYDAKMHGADWSAAKTRYEPLLASLADSEELHTVMMMMIGELNASHTGVGTGRGGGPGGQQRPQTRHPGFDMVSDASGFYKVGHVYKDGPADKDFLKITAGDFILAVDGHELKTSENYWRFFTLAPGAKFHFLVNDKPLKEGAWEVTITPVAGGELGTLQYRRWVDARRDLVTKSSNGEIGYLHIRAMDAPSLRQFQLDLAANRTKRALVIDQRFNGGGGIDQELLGILSGRRYQYTVGRDQPFQQPRPQNFYGPMVVMQNERSASDAEMFPAGFQALGLGKVIGVPTMGAVIGTGSYTLLDGSAIRTPGSGVWTAAGQNMENYGVPPDVYVDNTPADFVKGRDAQIEKAVEVLKAELQRKTTTSSQR